MALSANTTIHIDAAQGKGAQTKRSSYEAGAAKRNPVEAQRCVYEDCGSD